MKMRVAQLILCVACLAGGTVIASAEDVTVDMHKITSDGIGEKAGTVALADSSDGLTLKVSLKGIAPGEHGFHVHEKGDCGPGETDGKMAAGIAAGGHYDPQKTQSHQGPEGKGHEGDLPRLEATASGIDMSVTAPRLKLADVKGRSLMIHEGGDTYSDIPEMGGGKGRLYCGVIPKG
jgi:Cu-Zn family superoxide dismutase